MAEIYVRKVDGALHPANEDDYEKFKKIPENDVVRIKYTAHRNIKFHRKFFSLLNVVDHNQEKFDSIDILRSYLTMKAGYYEEVKTDKGVVYLPKSLSFESMDNIEFDTFYSKFLDQCIAFLGVTSEELENEIVGFG